MNEQESLQIIKDMMQKAKASHHRNSYYFIIWGVALIVAALTEYIVVYQMNSKFGFLGWMAAGIIGGIITGIYSSKESKRLGHEAFMDKVFTYTWGGFGITLVLILALTILNRMNPTPFILLATGIPTYISGGVTKFKPLQLGAVVFWIAGAICFFVPTAFTSLIFSGAVLLGYLVPGIMLRNSELQVDVQSA